MSEELSPIVRPRRIPWKRVVAVNAALVASSLVAVPPVAAQSGTDDGSPTEVDPETECPEDPLDLGTPNYLVAQSDNSQGRGPDGNGPPGNGNDDDCDDDPDEEVDPGPSIAYDDTVTGREGETLESFDVTANDDPSLEVAGIEVLAVDLPNGLTFHDDGTLEGWITGTPTECGRFTATYRLLSTSRSSDEADVVITIDCRRTLAVDDVINGSMNEPLTVNGGDWYVVTDNDSPSEAIDSIGVRSTNLPDGVSLWRDGTVSGTPTECGTFVTEYELVSTSGSTDSADLTVNVDCPPARETIANDDSLSGTVGEAIDDFLITDNDSVSSNFRRVRLRSGSLPDGLTLWRNGWITGTPTEAGTFEIEYRLVSTSGSRDEAIVTVTVDHPGGTGDQCVGGRTWNTPHGNAWGWGRNISDCDDVECRERNEPNGWAWGWNHDDDCDEDETPDPETPPVTPPDSCESQYQDNPYQDRGVEVHDADNAGWAVAYNFYDSNRRLIISTSGLTESLSERQAPDYRYQGYPQYAHYYAPGGPYGTLYLYEREWQAKTNPGFQPQYIRYVSAIDADGNESDLVACTTVDACPIGLDLDGSGSVERIEGSFRFDIDADGTDDVLGEWFAPTEGILVVPSLSAAEGLTGAHLFGDLGGRHTDGFEKLALRDANGDGTVSGDELSGMAVWVDADSDAELDAGELSSLDDHGIVSLSTDHTDFVSTAELADGTEMVTEDLWFPLLDSDGDQDSDA